MSGTKVFLSYAIADRDFAQDLRGRIEKLGLTIEEPSETLTAGSVWAEAVAAGIRRADAFLLVVPTAGSSGANNAFFEAGAARALGKRVIAVVPERAPGNLRELPTDVSSFIVTDASSQPMEQVAKTLVGALKAAA